MTYPPNIVGIDPSLTSTGVCLDDGSLHTIRSAPADNLRGELERIRAITGSVLAITDNADVIVLEAPSLGQSRQAGEHLRAGLWWHLVHLLAEQTPALIVRVPPSSLKKLATGRGNAAKPDMRMALYKRAGIDCADDNQVDAWWLREAGRQHYRHPDALDLPKTHLDALAKVQWPLL